MSARLGDKRCRLRRGARDLKPKVFVTWWASGKADELKVAALSDIGTHKQSNQDSYCLQIAESKYGEVAFAAICDGVGGLSAGEVASSTVISRLSAWFEADFARYAYYNAEGSAVSLQSLRNVWTQLLGDLNEQILRYGQERGMRLGTTVTCVLAMQGLYVAGHVGDCRLYLFRGGEEEVATEDQTAVAREVALGHLTFEEAEVHPQRNVILQAVGSQDGIAPAFYEGTYQENDLFLLCCDGFYRSLGDKLLAHRFGNPERLSSQDLQNICVDLVNLTKESGEKDNITALCFSFASEGALDDNTLVSGGDL